jgi:hypothetical protein
VVQAARRAAPATAMEMSELDTLKFIDIPSCSIAFTGL